MGEMAELGSVCIRLGINYLVSNEMNSDRIPKILDY